MRSLLLINFMTLLIYVMLFWLQDYGFQQASTIASLIFLPHGWRVVSFFLFKFKALPGLWAGHIATCMIYFPDFAETPITYVMTSSASVAGLPLMYLLLKRLGWDLFAVRKDYPVIPWTSFMAMGLIATAWNGLAVSAAFALTSERAFDVNIILQYGVGDTIGMVTFVGALIAYFRWQRRRASVPELRQP